MSCDKLEQFEATHENDDWVFCSSRNGQRGWLPKSYVRMEVEREPQRPKGPERRDDKGKPAYDPDYDRDRDYGKGKGFGASGKGHMDKGKPAYDPDYDRDRDYGRDRGKHDKGKGKGFGKDFDK